MNISELKRGEVIGGWTELRNKELHNLYSSQSIIRVSESMSTRWARHVVCMGETRSTYKLFLGKYEGKIPLGIRSR
jgi:hypothetical protein